MGIDYNVFRELWEFKAYSVEFLYDTGFTGEVLEVKNLSHPDSMKLCYTCLSKHVDRSGSYKNLKKSPVTYQNNVGH